MPGARGQQETSQIWPFGAPILSEYARKLEVEIYTSDWGSQESSLEVEALQIAGFGGFCLNTFAYCGNHRTLLASARCQTGLLVYAFCSHLILI